MSAATSPNFPRGLLVLKIIFAALILFEAAFILSVPLIPSMNDSGWYYMNVHFVKTGTYICESMYPSFQEPSQYYPFFGYSFFLYACEKIAGMLHADWASIVKLVQFIMYISCAFMAKSIVLKQTGRQHLSYIIAIIYLLYYPHFNHTNFVMSETYAGFLILFLVYLFVRLRLNFKTFTAILMFLVAGYCILVKPVFLPAVILIALLFFIEQIRNKKYRSLFCIFSILAFPLVQSVFSKTHYGNYSLQSGTGWHLWDRVIQSDKLIPENSVHHDNLKNIYAAHNKNVNYGFWWDVTRDLSDFGYTEIQTQEICKDVALDGIKENTGSYLLNSFRNSGITFLTQARSGDVYDSVSGYYEKIHNFSFEPQHIPLTEKLLQQNCFKSSPSALQELLIDLNFRFSQLSDPFNLLLHNWLVLALFILAGIFNAYLFIKSRFRENTIAFLTWFVAFTIIFCSNMLEYAQSRFMLPAVVFVIMSLMVTGDQLLKTKILKANKNEGEN